MQLPSFCNLMQRPSQCNICMWGFKGYHAGSSQQQIKYTFHGLQKYFHRRKEVSQIHGSDRLTPLPMQNTTQIFIPVQLFIALINFSAFSKWPQSAKLMTRINQLLTYSISELSLSDSRQLHAACNIASHFPALVPCTPPVSLFLISTSFLDCGMISTDSSTSPAHFEGRPPMMSFYQQKVLFNSLQVQCTRKLGA